MTWVEPSLLDTLGISGADQQQFAQDNGFNLGTAPATTPTGVAPTPPTTVTTGTDVTSGTEAINKVLKAAGLDPGQYPDLAAYAINLMTLGLTSTDRDTRVNSDIYDPTTVPGKIVATKYPEIAQRQKNGYGFVPVGTIIQYHDQIQNLFRDAGLPPGFTDSPSEISDLIANNWSPTEVQDRINQGYTAVANADPTIRNAFASFFGPSGDAALAAYMIDPTKATPVLNQQIAQATLAGTGTQFGFNIDQARAQELANKGVTASQARAGFADLANKAPLFDATISESPGLTAADQGVNSEFNLNGTDTALVNKRLEQRKAAFSGAGGPQSGASGQSGLGAASSR